MTAYSSRKRPGKALCPMELQSYTSRQSVEWLWLVVAATLGHLRLAIAQRPIQSWSRQFEAVQLRFILIR